MVDITLIIEGGAPKDTSDVQTVDNTPALRQSLHRIFNDVLGIETNITIDLGTNYRRATNMFCLSSKKRLYLFVDLDDAIDSSHWFLKLATEKLDNPIVVPSDKQEDVFFMIQETEAWILKQPASIERWGKHNNMIRLHPNEQVNTHSLIRNKNIESLRKPSDILATMLKHFYKKESANGIKKKVQYGKLTMLPSLLDHLDALDLITKDSELMRFKQIILSTQ